MSFSYQHKLTLDRDWVRWRVGDTTKATAELQDEEIDAVIGQEGDKRYAAAMCAESIAGRLTGSVDKKVGRLSISASQKAERYFVLAKQIRAEADTHAEPYAGGYLESDRQIDELDTDVIEHPFKIGQMDFPGTNPNTSGI